MASTSRKRPASDEFRIVDHRNGRPTGKAPIAKRPNHGTLGTPVKIFANHFLIEFSVMTLYQYDVRITPDVPRGLNRAVIDELVTQYRKDKLGGALPAYDGQKSLYTARPLSSEQLELDVTLPQTEENDVSVHNRNGGAVARPQEQARAIADVGEETGAAADSSKKFKSRRNRTFHVVLRESSRIDLDNLRAFLEGKIPTVPQEALQALDIVLREAPTKIFTPGGRSFFAETFGCSPLGNGIVSWRGFYQSIRPGQNGKLILNIDISASPFFQADLLPDFIISSLRVDINDFDYDLQQKPDGRTDAARVQLKKLLKGLRVQLTYGTKRKIRIQSLTDVPLCELSFDNNGVRMGVVEYFHIRYGYRIILKGLPAIQVGTNEQQTYIPMELCQIVKGQRFTKKLNDEQVRLLLQSTCSNPQTRLTETKRIAEQHRASSEMYTREFGINFDNKMAEIKGRILPSPKIVFAGKQEVSPQKGVWSTEGKTLNPKIACKWITERNGKVEKAVHYVSDEAKRNTGKDLELIFCILPDFDNQAIYGALKLLCDVELGIITQCFKWTKTKRANKSFWSNIILKINVKLGGKNALLVKDTNVLPKVSDVPTIIIGADVSHPKVGDDHSPSLAAVVASMDWPCFSRYKTVTRSQTHRTEIVEDLFWERIDKNTGKKEFGGILIELLTSFEKSTGHRPHRIVYYRDGVSDGQFEAVMKQEVEAVKEACVALWSTESSNRREISPYKKQKTLEGIPKITFAVVQKRHHTRLFPGDMQKMGSGNVIPGTIVDSVICHPTQFDFFLCSHAAIQGTTRPAHYHVLLDENGFTADQMQKLTNDLCFTYARCCRSVSIVPPCYYAHLAAARARVWVEREHFSESGSGIGSKSSGGNFLRARGSLGPVRPLPLVNDRLKSEMYYL